MTAVLLTPLTGQFFDNNGNPLNGGLVYSYVAGTSFGTPLATYTNALGTTPATNPVVLNSAGRADIWGSGTYDFKITDSLNNTIDTISSVVAIFGTGDMTKAVYDPANISQQLVGTTAVQTITNKAIGLTGGSTTVAPIAFTAGTNLTTAAAGSEEYDGKVLYYTPQGAQRGIIEAAQEYILEAALGGTSTTAAQMVLGVGVTLSSTTIYEFEAGYFLSKAAGTTSHTISTLFSGTATLTNIAYDVTYSISNAFIAPSVNNLIMVYFQTAAANVVNLGSASAAQAHIFKIHGTVSVNAGGTFIPEYQLSAAPGAGYVAAIGSYFKIWPTGAGGSNINVGTWA